MAHDFKVIDSSEELGMRLDADLIHRKSAEAMLVDIGGGLLRFSDTVFPDLDRDRIYVQKFKREAEGTGPHFDLHGEIVDTNYPWIGVYNLLGNNVLRAVRMPKGLYKSYLETYPGADDSAFAARRHFGAIALNSSKLDRAEGVLDMNMGLVLPQTPSGPQIVHEITPTDSSNPGEFVKLTTAANESMIEVLRGEGYVLLDELVTEGLGGVIGTIRDQREPTISESDTQSTSEAIAEMFGPDADDSTSRVPLDLTARTRGMKEVHHPRRGSGRLID
jgi:hypothetical protein